VGFLVGKVALGQVFSKYFNFPCQSSTHQFLNNHQASSGCNSQSPTPLRIIITTTTSSQQTLQLPSLERGVWQSLYKCPHKMETAAFAKNVGKPSTFNAGYFQKSNLNIKL
jgi:hypothetical protein